MQLFPRFCRIACIGVIRSARRIPGIIRHTCCPWPSGNLYPRNPAVFAYESRKFCIKQNGASQADYLLSDVPDHTLEQISPYVGLLLIQDLFRRSVKDQFVKHFAYPHILYACGQLSV